MEKQSKKSALIGTPSVAHANPMALTFYEVFQNREDFESSTDQHQGQLLS
jgi:hypothetical protein